MSNETPPKPAADAAQPGAAPKEPPTPALTKPPTPALTKPPTPALSSPPSPALAKEIGGAPGPEPTRYGDWQHKGRVTDF